MGMVFGAAVNCTYKGSEISHLIYYMFHGVIKRYCILIAYTALLLQVTNENGVFFEVPRAADTEWPPVRNSESRM